jgi:hypothetical protein
VTAAEVGVEAMAGFWPQLEDLVPPELPPDVAVARLVALARSLLIENRELREIIEASERRGVHLPDLNDALAPHRDGLEAA